MFDILKKEYINIYGKRKMLMIRSFLLYYRSLEFRVVILIRYYLASENSQIKKHLRKKLSLKYHVDIGRNPKIGKNFRFAHFQGTIIGNEVVIGDNCTIYQQVTLGQKIYGLAGYGDDPILGDNIVIFAGAKVLGKIHVGNNSVVGANAVVLKDVPENSCAVGIPAHIIKGEDKNNGAT
ncbi:transferase hexapeptide repeat containing protein [Clostridium sp. DL-VIII]|uniref:serine O-acetyltransferase n=1 Tax=Clostridium sp. DL-VIII TaxID=641107 RepID=UPI00023AFC88|nr:serine acetyltransferase [Clostridium sp. DL-VIII]EHI98325.1 transferase hexapeptide repeat containing protein [Clostridium sp. DL-VIII]